MKIEIGQRVKVVRSHWARPRQPGIITEINRDGSFVVQFDYKGIGFNGGLCLQLRQEDLEELSE